MATALIERFRGYAKIYAVAKHGRISFRAGRLKRSQCRDRRGIYIRGPICIGSCRSSNRRNRAAIENKVLYKFSGRNYIAIGAIDGHLDRDCLVRSVIQGLPLDDLNRHFIICIDVVTNRVAVIISPPILLLGRVIVTRLGFADIVRGKGIRIINNQRLQIIDNRCSSSARVRFRHQYIISVGFINGRRRIKGHRYLEYLLIIALEAYPIAHNYIVVILDGFGIQRRIAEVGEAIRSRASVAGKVTVILIL